MEEAICNAVKKLQYSTYEQVSKEYIKSLTEFENRNGLNKYQKAIREAVKEVTEVRRVKETEISEIDIQLKENYEQKLADTLHELRTEYETQMLENRDEIETIYESKIADLQAKYDRASNSYIIYRDELRSLKTKIDSQTSKHTTLENQEVTEVRRVKETEISEIDTQLKENYEQKLADSVRELRTEYETQMLENRDEIETIYESKIADLQAKYDRASNSYISYRDELRSLKTKIDSLTSKHTTLENQEQLKAKVVFLQDLMLMSKQNAQREIEKSELKASFEEVTEVRRVKETEISEIDTQLKENYEQKLADTLHELRTEYETQMLENRDEIETIYESKIADLQAKYDRASNSYISYRDELRSLKTKIDSQTSKHTTLENQEVTEVRRVKETEISEIDTQLKENYEQKLADSVRELRTEYETQMLENRDEIETIYESKIADLQAKYDRASNSYISYRDELRSLKTKIDSLTSKHTNLENQEQLKAKVVFLQDLMLMSKQNAQREIEKSELKASFEEVTEVRRVKETEISEIDTQLKENYEQKLADTLHELRTEYETQMLENRDEIETIYESKIADLQAKYDRASNSYISYRDELRSLKTKIDSLTSKHTNLENQNMSLQSRIKDLEKMLEQEREWYHDALQAKGGEIRLLREEMEKQLAEYHDLLDIKIALDLEISAY